MSSTALVRAGGFADAEVLAALHAGAFKADWSADELRRLMETPRSFAVVAEADHEAIGFAIGWAPADEAEILTIAVTPSQRGKGVGRALLAASLASARALGAASMFLDVDETNTAARALYRSFGFREVGRRRGYYRTPDGGRNDAIVLRLGMLDS